MEWRKGMKRAEVLTTAGILMMILGAAGLAGAIEQENGLILALGVTVIGIAMIIAGLGLESRNDDESFDSKFTYNNANSARNKRY